MGRNLKLNDFDYKIKIEKDIMILIKLYRRLLNMKNDEYVNIYDITDAQIKTFVINSIYYIFLRDHELYKTKS